MKTHQGISLPEVLFSLLLISCSSFWLVTQQSQVNYQTHDTKNRTSQMLQKDNQYEYFNEA